METEPNWDDYLGEDESVNSPPANVASDGESAALDFESGDQDTDISSEGESDEDESDEDVPAKKAPAKKAPAKKAPAKKTPTKKAPAKKAPAKKASAKKAPAKKASAKKTPTKKAPAKKTPTKKTPTKKAPAKKTPAKKAPAKKVPAKKTPTKKAPAQSKKRKSAGVEADAVPAQPVEFGVVVPSMPEKNKRYMEEGTRRAILTFDMMRALGFGPMFPGADLGSALAESSVIVNDKPRKPANLALSHCKSALTIAGIQHDIYRVHASGPRALQVMFRAVVRDLVDNAVTARQARLNATKSDGTMPQHHFDVGMVDIVSALRRSPKILSLARNPNDLLDTALEYLESVQNGEDPTADPEKKKSAPKKKPASKKKPSAKTSSKPSVKKAKKAGGKGKK